jgi:hypothetical protein
LASELPRSPSPNASTTSSLWEIAQAIGSEPAAEDAIVGLRAAGLVHRFGEFVFPTRPAARFDQLEYAE